MARPIKYKVWDKAKKKLSLVARINYGDDGFAGTVTIEPAPIGKYSYVLVHGENGMLLEYTSFNDSNGIEVYEGFILKIIVNGIIEHREVFWDDTTGTFLTKNDRFRGFYTMYGLGWIKANASLFEVIGNIYENPELLNHYKPQPNDF